jgi:uncharacterized protein
MTLVETARHVARELALPVASVEAALRLFDEGNTLPFVARYRKERVGGLDEVQLRRLQRRAHAVAELEERRRTIVASVEEQGVLTPELRRSLEAASTRQALEDLYLPHRPRRRSRATTARERGLEPLARRIASGDLDDHGVRTMAERFVEPAGEVSDVDAALRGACDILGEELAEDAGLRGWARRRMEKQGTVVSRVRRGKKTLPGAAIFRDYFDRTEPLRAIASHRVLALRRGESEGILAWGIVAPEEVLQRIITHGRSLGGARHLLGEMAADAWKRLIHPSLESELKGTLVEQAEDDAIRIFGVNLENLLLQPPAGERAVLGLDPGFRTGVKVAMVSNTGEVVATAVIHLHQAGRFDAELQRLVRAHEPDLIAVGNGTASRETEAAVRKAMGGDGPPVVSVNEAGASVYSASELAGRELPDMDVSLRGAVSIARRLQDPLAELVKIDARSIGVGQYQHDVNQTRLGERLDHIVERCVNGVGVELNTASPALLSYVAGIGPTLAESLVRVRDARGGFESRRELLEVPRLGQKTFEQAAGFLRVRGGPQVLDATAVHPERYPLVERMARDLGVGVGDLVADEAHLTAVESRFDRYTDEEVGLPTLRDIVDELGRPGRDPRDRFEPPAFREDVRKLTDLAPGMTLPGVVTNVVAFGAFVDVGVHQDGLVHVSQLGAGFVRAPADVVKVGQRVNVRVLSVDPERRRIGLSMKPQ